MAALRSVVMTEMVGAPGAAGQWPQSQCDKAGNERGTREHRTANTRGRLHRQPPLFGKSPRGAGLEARRTTQQKSAAAGSATPAASAGGRLSTHRGHPAYLGCGIPDVAPDARPDGAKTDPGRTHCRKRLSHCTLSPLPGRSRYGFHSALRRIGKGWGRVLGIIGRQLGPDAAPVSGPQLAPGHLAATRGLDSRAVFRWYGLACPPVGNDALADANGTGQLADAAHFVDRNLKAFHERRF